MITEAKKTDSHYQPSPVARQETKEKCNIQNLENTKDEEEEKMSSLKKQKGYEGKATCPLVSENQVDYME